MLKAYTQSKTSSFIFNVPEWNSLKIATVSSLAPPSKASPLKQGCSPCFERVNFSIRKGTDRPRLWVRSVAVFIRDASSLWGCLFILLMFAIDERLHFVIPNVVMLFWARCCWFNGMFLEVEGVVVTYYRMSMGRMLSFLIRYTLFDYLPM